MAISRLQAPTIATATGGTSVGLAWTSTTGTTTLKLLVIAGRASTSLSAFTPPANWLGGTSFIGTANRGWTRIYYDISTSHTGTETYSVTGASPDLALGLYEYDGGSGTWAFDVEAGQDGNNMAPDSGTTGTLAASSNELVFASIANGNVDAQTSPTYTPAGTQAAINNATSANGTAGNRVTLYTYQNVVSSTSGARMQATIAANRGWLAAVSAFKFTPSTASVQPMISIQTGL